MLVGLKLLGAVAPKIDAQGEAAESRNIAPATVAGAVHIGLMLTLGRVISA